ncbi:MAG TPA: hypothetical protein VMF30_17325 [Pirellulales bacterium]|nr:hypothetical protein [Pirellulales bacterium]
MFSARILSGLCGFALIAAAVTLLPAYSSQVGDYWDSFTADLLLCVGLAPAVALVAYARDGTLNPALAARVSGAFLFNTLIWKCGAAARFWPAHPDFQSSKIAPIAVFVSAGVLADLVIWLVEKIFGRLIAPHVYPTGNGQ